MRCKETLVYKRIAFTLHFLRIAITGRGPKPPKMDVIDFYSFTRDPGADASSAASIEVGPEKTVNWVVPDFKKGSGGHINIFRLIGNLERNGYRCRIFVDGLTTFTSGATTRDYICEHFNRIEAPVEIGTNRMPPAWNTVATSWMTAYSVRSFQNTEIKSYFIQDFEPYFYAHSSEYVWAEDTYRFGFFGVTAGDWLAQKLSRDYGMTTKAIGFSYDRERYTPKPRLDPSLKQVFFYARPVTYRRCFEMGLMVLDEVARRRPDIQFVLAGWDSSRYVIPFKHVDAGVVPLDQLADLYSQCDGALVLSITNLSLLPLELMACGCPVVSNNGPNVEWLLNDENAVLVEARTEALVEALVALLDDEPRRQHLIKQGLAFVEQTSWEAEAQRFCSYFDELVRG